MKSALIVALVALAFSSCTSAYKTGQTPDDVYYSPARPGGGGEDEYVQAEKRDDRRYQGTDEYYEDRYLRMRANDRYRWSVLDDYYMNSPYAYNYYGSYYGNSLFSPYNNYWTWNTYYNPYCNYYSSYPYYGGYYGGGNVIIIKNPGTSFTPPSRPVAFNANSYSSNPGNTGSRAVNNRYVSSYAPSNSGSTPRYNNSNRNSSNNFSNTMQKMFSNSNSSNNSSNNSNNSSSTPARSYQPSSSSSSSSSGSSGGSSSGGASRPNR